MTFGSLILPVIAVAQISIPQPCETVWKPGWADNSVQQMAFQISRCDKDFVRTLDMENGCWDPTRKALGKEDAWGFCQFNRRWWSHIVDDPRFFTDTRWQLEQCYEKYKAGVRFYGYDVRHKSNLVFWK